MGFFRNETEDSSPEVDFRSEERRKLTGRSQHYTALMNGASLPLRDISERGFSVSGDEATAPTRGVVQIVLGGRVIKSGFAMRAWGEGRAIGYSFLHDLPVAVCAGSQDEADIRARGIRRRLSREIEKTRYEQKPSAPAKDDGKPRKSFGRVRSDAKAAGAPKAADRRPTSIMGLRERLGFNVKDK
ncbi:MAG: hypothetical protein AAGF51_06680 [Pseudomonadota bacterium]